MHLPHAATQFETRPMHGNERRQPLHLIQGAQQPAMHLVQHALVALPQRAKQVRQGHVNKKALHLPDSCIIQIAGQHKQAAVRLIHRLWRQRSMTGLQPKHMKKQWMKCRMKQDFRTYSGSFGLPSSSSTSGGCVVTSSVASIKFWDIAFLSLPSLTFTLCSANDLSAPLPSMIASSTSSSDMLLRPPSMTTTGATAFVAS